MIGLVLLTRQLRTSSAASRLAKSKGSNLLIKSSITKPPSGSSSSILRAKRKINLLQNVDKTALDRLKLIMEDGLATKEFCSSLVLGKNLTDETSFQLIQSLRTQNNNHDIKELVWEYVNTISPKENDEDLLHFSKGNLFFAFGDVDKARDEFNSALTKVETKFGSNHTHYAFILSHLANCDLSQNRQENALQKYRLMNHIEINFFGEHDYRIVESFLNRINACYHFIMEGKDEDQKLVQEVMECMEKVEELKKKHMKEIPSSLLGQIYLTSGRVLFNIEKKYSLAKRTFQLAVEEFEKCGNLEGIGRALLEMSSVMLKQQEMRADSNKETVFQFLELVKDIQVSTFGENSTEAAIIYETLGDAKPETAKEYYELALGVYENNATNPTAILRLKAKLEEQPTQFMN